MVKKILSSVTIPVQLGGGIRERAQVEAWLNAGISRVILGTVAVKNPALVKEVARDFPGKIVVGIDARGGKSVREKSLRKRGKIDVKKLGKCGGLWTRWGERGRSADEG